MSNEELILEKLARIEARLDGVDRLKSSCSSLPRPGKTCTIWAATSPS